MSQSNRLRADAIRFLSMDAVQAANSGHPGMPMGMADIAEVLWHEFLNHNPNNPKWLNRDRFVLSNGHGCMLLYSLLHLTGYDLSLNDLKHFRKLHSKTPGHPELGDTPGVETTTGPLGQGLANAVGMALGQKHLASIFNKPEFPIIDHHIYCFVGDGCLMEGISHEVSSLAGTLQLNKLIVFYDDNNISIDGAVNNWFSDNTPKRFESYGWQVIANVDGHDSHAIHEAIVQAKKQTQQPTMICCKTQIGFGAPTLAGTAATHGAPLGSEEIKASRQQMNWEHEAFHIPNEVYQSWDAKTAGKEKESAWQSLFNNYQKAHPELAAEFLRRMKQSLPINWQTNNDQLLDTLFEQKQNVATRKASQLFLDAIAPNLPELIGGSADLTESNCTNWKGMEVFTPAHPWGRYLHYGVREFGMSAIMNGLALHGGIIPFGGTFLTFSDYARNAVRLSALMRQKVIYVYSHDSIGLGEDGPTHQPIEQLPSLRIIPGLTVWRPCDTLETAVAWQASIENNGPSCLLLSRQALPHQVQAREQTKDIANGAYVLIDYAKNRVPDAILIATGSEVHLATEAAKVLAEKNILVRVVSMPSTNVFLKQDASYQQTVLPDEVTARVVIEAAASAFWYQFVGKEGAIIGIDHFGASAPAKDLFAHYGFTIENVVQTTQNVIAKLTAQQQSFLKCATA